MAVSAFKDVIWNSSDRGTTAKLNTMAQNTRYLLERAPKLYYNSYGVKKDVGVKIGCGVVPVPSTVNSTSYVTVNFGSFFSVGSKPVVVTSLTSPVNTRVIDTIYGLGGTYTVPDHRGFGARVAATEIYGTMKNLPKTIYLNWVAVGY